MGKDIPEKRLESWNDVFADIFNNLFFEGNAVLREEELVALPTESYMKKVDGAQREGSRDIHKAVLTGQNDFGHSAFVDIQKSDRNGGRYRLICGLENQTGVDNTMPERIMMYDCADYEEQIRLLMDQNRKEQREAFVKRLHDDQRLAPVITLVLYYGSKEGERPRSLHDMLEFPEEIEECVKPLVADYPMNLIRVGGLSEEERARLKSDFRLVAEYVAREDDEEKLDQFFRENRQEIRHEEEFLDIMGELTGKKYHREILKTIKEEKGTEGGGIRMFDLITKYEEKGRLKGKEEGKREGRREGRREGKRIGRRTGRREGRREGRLEGIRALICDNRSNQVPRDVIVEKLVGFFSITREEAERYYDKVVLEGTEEKE